MYISDPLQLLILDEADEMLQHGFKNQIYGVYRFLPPEVQVFILPLQVQVVSALFKCEWSYSGLSQKRLFLCAIMLSLWNYYL